MKHRIATFLRENYSLAFIFLTGLILIVGPFLLRNNLEGFDTAGQIASVFYIKNYFWPWPNGWNSMFLAGFPQGLIYPPFFHWLSAAVSFVLPIKMAYKLLLSSAIIIFPLIYFYLSKKILKSSLIAGASLLLVSLFYYFDLGLNDNLFADLYFGMAPHLFSITLLFAYIYSLYLINEGNIHWYWSGLLIALTISTHVFSGMTAVLLGIIFLIFSYNKDIFKDVLKHLVLGAILSAWWWLPFIVNINYVTGSDNNSVVSPIILLLMPLIFVINLLAFRKKEGNESGDFIKSLSLFSSLILLFFLIGRMNSIDNFPIHFSRFVVYSLLITPILICNVLRNSKINWHKINIALIFIFGFYFFFFKITPVGPFDTFILDGVKDVYEKGRVIVTGGSRYLDDRFHVTRVKLAIESKIPTSEGLFVESSVNGWFVMSMMKSWENTVPTFVWAYMDLKDVADLKWGNQVFGVNYEYRINDRKPSSEEKDLLQKSIKSTTTTEILENKINTDVKIKNTKKSALVKAVEKEERIKNENKIIENERNERNLKFKLTRENLFNDERVTSIFAEGQTPFYYQSFYKINNTSLAEALDVRPIDVSNNWNELTKRWWSTDWLKQIDEITGDYEKPVLVYRKDTKKWDLAPVKTNLEVKEVGKKMDKFTVDASAFKKPVPVYVKVSYFPFWKAYDEQGNSLKIIKASPNFMLVYGNGLITFKYEEPWYYYFGFIISGFGLLFVFYKVILIFFDIKYFSNKRSDLKRKKVLE